MADLLISTTCRHRPASEPSGYLYQVDTEGGRVVGSCPVPTPPYLEVDPNPRGGLRGARGLAVSPQRIALSHHCEIFLFDPQWQLEGKITHPSCGSIHDIIFDGDTLIAASARNDLVFRFALGGERLWHWNARSAAELQSALPELPGNRLLDAAVIAGEIDFRDPRTHDYETYNRTHLNGICALPNGDLLVLLGILWSDRFIAIFRLRSMLQRIGLWKLVVSVNRLLSSLLPKQETTHTEMVVQPARSRSVVVRISRDGSCRPVLEIPNTTTPSHTVLQLDEQTCFVLDTTAGRLIAFDPGTGRVSQTCQITSDGFLRGALVLSDGRLALGSRGNLLIFDLDAESITGTIQLSDDPHEAIYSIQHLPDAFAPLPRALSVEPS